MDYKINHADRSNYGGMRNVSNIKYIVIHYTANDGDTDENNANYFKNNKNLQASAHYFVDDDSVTQSVPDSYIAYSVGGAKWNNAGGRLYGKANNSNSLSIELCDTRRDGTIKATQRTIDNAIEFVKEKMKAYNIPPSNVIRHYDVNGKTCPAFWVNDTLWKSEFLDRLNGFVWDGIDFSYVFDAEYYAKNNPDVVKVYGNNPDRLFEHFKKYGFRENRKISPKFDINAYWEKNTDLRILLYRHYCEMGHKESRLTQ